MEFTSDLIDFFKVAIITMWHKFLASLRNWNKKFYYFVYGEYLFTFIKYDTTKNNSWLYNCCVTVIRYLYIWTWRPMGFTKLEYAYRLLEYVYFIGMMGLYRFTLLFQWRRVFIDLLSNNLTSRHNCSSHIWIREWIMFLIWRYSCQYS